MRGMTRTWAHPRVPVMDSSPVVDHTVVVLTGGTDDAVATVLADAIRLPDFDDDDSWVARTAIAISSDPEAARSPLILVLSGSLARHAPSLGFAQRAARRSVHGYVLIDPRLPAPGTASDWPDAPVTVVIPGSPDSPDANGLDSRVKDATLRGWEVVIGAPSAVITGLVGRP